MRPRPAPPPVTVITEPGIAMAAPALRALHREAAIATLDWLTESGAVNDAIREVLTHLDSNTGLYVDYLSRMLATRDQWLPFIGSGLLQPDEWAALRRQLEGNIELAVQRHLQKTRAALHGLDQKTFAELADYAAR